MRYMRYSPKAGSDWLFRQVAVRLFPKYKADINAGWFEVTAVQPQQDGGRLIIGKIQAPILSNNGKANAVRTKAMLAFLQDTEGNIERIPIQSTPE